MLQLSFKCVWMSIETLHMWLPRFPARWPSAAAGLHAPVPPRLRGHLVQREHSVPSLQDRPQTFWYWAIKILLDKGTFRCKQKVVRKTFTDGRYQNWATLLQDRHRVSRGAGNLLFHQLNVCLLVPCLQSLFWGCAVHVNSFYKLEMRSDIFSILLEKERGRGELSLCH